MRYLPWHSLDVLYICISNVAVPKFWYRNAWTWHSLFYTSFRYWAIAGIILQLINPIIAETGNPKCIMIREKYSCGHFNVLIAGNFWFKNQTNRVKHKCKDCLTHEIKISKRPWNRVSVPLRMVLVNCTMCTIVMLPTRLSCGGSLARLLTRLTRCMMTTRGRRRRLWGSLNGIMGRGRRQAWLLDSIDSAEPKNFALIPNCPFPPLFSWYVDHETVVSGSAIVLPREVLSCSEVSYLKYSSIKPFCIPLHLKRSTSFQNISIRTAPGTFWRASSWLWSKFRARSDVSFIRTRDFLNP